MLNSFGKIKEKNDITRKRYNNVAALRKLVVLTKSGLTCGDIMKVRDGEWTLQQKSTTIPMSVSWFFFKDTDG